MVTFYGLGTIMGAGTYVLLGSFVAFYAFIGFEDMVNVAEETKRPRRNLPIAIILSMVLVMVLYLGVSLAALHVLPASDLAASKAPLSAVMEAAGGSSRLTGAISALGLLGYQAWSSLGG